MVIIITKRLHDPIVVMNRLKALRHEKGLTQKQVAEAIHFSVSTIKQYESGNRIPDEDNLNTLASFYKVYPKYILGETNFKNRSEEMLHRWTEDVDIKKLTAETHFIDSAEKLGFFIRSDLTSEEYDRYIEYNKRYEERKEAMKTRSEIKVIIGSEENRIIESFETGEITIQAVSEEDVEKGFQQLIRRGIIEG